MRKCTRLSISSSGRSRIGSPVGALWVPSPASPASRAEVEANALKFGQQDERRSRSAVARSLGRRITAIRTNTLASSCSPWVPSDSQTQERLQTKVCGRADMCLSHGLEYEPMVRTTAAGPNVGILTPTPNVSPTFSRHTQCPPTAPIEIGWVAPAFSQWLPI